ncbi:MAG: molybdopterin-dependent oxidoreductase [Comamonadaceae bacterium]|nr:molybdopterin-dependent oxidoreductase [Comamonadaceae bacterium]
MSTIGDDLLREASPASARDRGASSSTTATRWRWRPTVAKVVAGFAREDLFTVVLEHFLTDTADHADYVLPATTQLEHWDVHTAYGHTVRAAQPSRRSSRSAQARRTREIFRALAARMGFDRALLRRQRRDDGAPAPSSPTRVDFDGAARRAAGRRLPLRRRAVRRRRLPHAERQVPSSTRRGLGVPDYVPQLRERASRARARARATRWR